MAILTSKNNDTVTITLDSKFDFNSLDEFHASYQNNAANSYVVDFRNTEYMDSSGLGMLLYMKRHLSDGSSIKLLNCRPQIKKVLIISRFGEKFTIA